MRNNLTYKMKTCTKCNTELDNDSFYKNSKTLDGLSSWCKTCTSNASKYVPKPRKRAEKENHKHCAKCDSEKPITEFNANHRSKDGLSSWCKECKQAYDRARMTKQSAILTEKYNNDPFFKWKTKTRQALRDMIYRSGLLKEMFEKAFIEEIGCSIAQFKEYIEKQFKPGMNWTNYGKGPNKWQLDHINPIQPEDINKNVNHFSNLQPLWQAENIKKGDSQDSQMAEEILDEELWK